MKKVAVVVLAFATVMMVLPFSTVFAGSPMVEVSGTIASGGTSTTVVKDAADNHFLFITTASTWSGGISGSTTGSQTWIAHKYGPPPEFVNVNVELYFTTATVDGKTGTMTIEMNMITFPTHLSDSHGTWRIKDAEGALEGLHGEGVWLLGPNRYEGKVHFSK